ncbi:MAG: Na+/H+ antiporter NhaC [Bacteroidales bacterium]|nr:Na+/H+ antiporter NhaC [Bacteroidales bacterium]
MTEESKKPTIIHALLPIIFLIGLLVMNLILFEDTLSGANQMALLLSATFAALIAFRFKVNWTHISRSIIKSISTAMPSILILLMIGALAGTWIISGVVPAMIYYGLKILHPKIFLFAAVVICCIVSLATGSSWSTIATIGVALLGIGKAIGIPPGLVGGAIISGAYFGDKMSPLSDTTNLAPAMAGTDLFTHIRYMTITTAPSILITLIIFLIIGLSNNNSHDANNIKIVQESIEKGFHINPLLFLVPVILIIIIIKKVPPLPAILSGAVLGGIFAIIFQPQIIKEFSQIDTNYFKASYITVMKAMYGDVQIHTESTALNELFSTSGMRGMLDTVWLILSAMIFGGAMEAGGLLVRITKSIIKRAKSTSSIIASTIGSCIFFNATASDQYISIVVPGRMFSDVYRKKGLKPEVLSRSLEDAGTLTSVLIPWNTCGATQARILGIPTFTYAPFCFFNIINPIIAIIIASINFKIRKYTSEELKELEKTEKDKTIN